MLQSRILSIFLGLVSIPLAAVASWEPYVAMERMESSKYGDIGSGPSFAFTEWVAGVRASRGNRNGQFSLDAGYGYLNADWGGGGFAGESPYVAFEEVETWDLSVMRTGLLRGDWSYAVLLGVESSRVTKGPLDQASFSDALSYLIGGGISYQFNPNLRLGVVVLYSDSAAGIQADWIGFLSVYWRINENWTLQTRRGLVLTWNSGGERLEHEVTFSGNFSADREWHLGDSASGEPAYEEEGYALGISYGIALDSGFSIEVQGHYVLEREVNIWQRGRRVASSDIENGFSYGFQIAYSF